MDIKISVIMSVYNTKEEYLREAIESILNQSLMEYQFIIVNDGSDDKTVKILEEYRRRDKRIELIHNKENYGLTASLNIGITYARGKYIARMDSDDISALERFRVQYQYMEAHLDIAVLGGWVVMGNKVFKSCWRAENEWRKVYMLFGNAGIFHPAAFMRKSFLDENGIRYDERMKKAQDYDLWCQCLDYGKIAVIPQIVLNYRISDDQISVKNKGEQDYYRDMVRKKQLDKVFDGYSERELSQFLDMHKEILSGRELDAFWNKILKSNDEKETLDAQILKYKFFEEWVKILVGKYPRKKRMAFLSKRWLFMMLSPKVWLHFINNRLIVRT